MTDTKLEIVLTAREAAATAFESVKRQCSDLTNSVFSLNTAMGILAGAGGMGYLIKQNLDLTAEMYKNSQMAGVTAKAYQELTYVADQYMISQDAIMDGLKELNLRAEEFVITGAGPGSEAFSRLGFSQDELNKKLSDTPSLLIEIVDRLQDLGPAARLRIADEIFGGQGGEQFASLINGGADAIEEFTQKARDMGLILDDQTAAGAVKARVEIENLTKQVNANFVRVVADLAPDIRQVAQATGDWVTQNKDFVSQKIPEIIGGIKDGIVGIKNIYDGIPDELKGAAGVGLIGSILYGPQGGLILAAGTAAIQGQNDFLEAMEGYQAGIISLDELNSGTDIRDAALERYRKHKEAVRSVTKEINDATEGWSEYIAAQAKATGTPPPSVDTWAAAYEAQATQAMQAAIEKQITIKASELEKYKSSEAAKPEIVTYYEEQISALRDKYAADQKAKQEKQLQELQALVVKSIDDLKYEKLNLTDKEQAMLIDPDLVAKTKAIMDKRQKAIDDALKKEARAYEKHVEDIESSYKSLYENVEGIVYGLTDNFDDVGDYIEETLKTSVKKAGSAIATTEIVMPLTLSIGSMLGASWQGTSFEDMAKASGVDSGGGVFNTLGTANTAYNVLTGGLSTSVYNLSTTALDAMGLGWETTIALGETLSALAGPLAIAAAAIPVIMNLMENDPTPAIGLISDAANTPPGEGEINSMSGYDYRVWLQDVGGRSELGEGIITYFDALFSAIDETTEFSVAEALKNVEWDRNVELDKFGGDTEAALAELTDQVFESVAGTLVSQLVGADIAGYFGTEFFQTVQSEGGYETRFEAFAEFSSLVQANENFAEDFARQVNDYGASASTAYTNLKTISAGLSEVQSGLETITGVSSIGAIQDLTSSWQDLITTMEEANARAETVADAKSDMAQVLGANITGLTADSIAAALASGSDMSATLETSISGAAYAYIAKTITDSYLGAINAQVGQVWIDTGGDIQAVVDAMRGIDTSDAEKAISDLVDQFGLLTVAAGSASTLEENLSSAADDLESALKNEITYVQGELSVLEGNLDTARDNYLAALDYEIEKQEEARDAAEDAAGTFRDLADTLGDAKTDILVDAGVLSGEETISLMRAEFEDAVKGSWRLDPDAISDLPDIARAYLSAAKGSVSSADYNDLVGDVYSQLSAVETLSENQVKAQEEVVEAAEDQLDALQDTRDEISGVAGTLLSMDTAADEYYAAALAIDESGFEQELAAMEAQLAELQLLNTNIISLADARTAYNAAQTAVDTGVGSSSDFDEEIYLENKLNWLNSNANSAEVLAANEKYGNTDGIWTRAELDAALAVSNLTAKEHFERYGYGEGVSGTEIQAYADGGYHPGGLALVGEDGPELVELGPGYVHTASATQQLFDVSRLSEELRAIRDILERIEKAGDARFGAHSRFIGFVKTKLTRFDEIGILQRVV